jgi:hypothetical protein
MPSWIGQVAPMKHDNSIVQTFSPQISSYKGSYSLSYNYITTEPGLYKMKHSNSKNMPMDVKQLSPKHINSLKFGENFTQQSSTRGSACLESLSLWTESQQIKLV